MEQDYGNELIKQYQNRQNLIKKNLMTPSIFPDRSNPIKSLAPAEEFLLKATYELRTGFLSDFSFLFAYIYSKQKFESAVLSLEKQGYIKAQTSKDYGKYWVLSSLALYYIETDQSVGFSNCNLKDCTFPSSNRLAYYKALNGYFCQRVFKQRTKELMARYQKEERDFRIRYQKEQFIKAYLFGSSDSAYSKEAANQFVLTIWDEFEQNETLKTKYRGFVRAFKENEKKQYVDHTLLQYAFLKDYFNDLHLGREQSVKETSNLFFKPFQTVFKSDQFLSRIILYNNLTSNQEIKKELDLFLYEELFANLSMIKRNLTKAVPQTEEEALLLSDKINSLDKKLTSLEQTIEHYKEGFEVMVFDKFVNEIASFKSCAVTIKSLANLQCHLVGFSPAEQDTRPLLTWAIFQPNAEEFSVSSLFSKIEKIYKFQFHHLQMTDYEFLIVTHSDSQKKIIETKLEAVKESFEQIGNYGLLLFHLDEIKVISTQSKRKERYAIFNEFEQKAKFSSLNKKD